MARLTIALVLLACVVAVLSVEAEKTESKDIEKSDDLQTAAGGLFGYGYRPYGGYYGGYGYRPFFGIGFGYGGYGRHGYGFGYPGFGYGGGYGRFGHFGFYG